MRKIRFNPNHYNTARRRSGMAGEKLLIAIEKYIGLDIAIMLLGLLYSSEDGRGFPLPWLSEGQADSVKFLSSLAFVTVLVIIGDIITRAAIRASEPVTKVQRTMQQYASTYSEYEDPLVSEVKQNYARQYSSQTRSKAEVRNTPQTRSSGAAGPARSRAGSSNYEKSMADDYSKIRSQLGIGKSGKKPSVPKTVNIQKMLNGQDAVPGRDKNQKGPGVVFLTAALVIIMSIMASGITMCADDDFTYDDDWTENIEMDDSDIDESFDDDPLLGSCEEYLYDLQSDDAGWLDEFSDDEADAVSNALDWENSYYEFYYSAHTDESSEEASVYRFKVTDEEGEYLVAFKFTSDDPSEDPSSDIAGVSVCPYPSFADEYPGLFGADSFYETYADSDETMQSYLDEIESTKVSAGDDRIDDKLILLW